MEDNAIIGMLYERTEEALTVLQDRYGRLCLGVAKNILGSPEDAEECVNDTLDAVWNRIPPEKPDPLLPYVLRITRNIALNRRRAAMAKKRYAGENLSLETVQEEREDILAELAVYDRQDTDEALLQNALNGFLAGLRTEERILFLRRYWFEDPVPEIAKQLGITENHARVRLTRLKNRLKRYLEQEGIVI